VFNNPNPSEEGEALAEFVNPKRSFTGFCVELLDQLQEKLGFEYEIQILNTSTSKDLLEAVKQQRADIAISDITITRDRQSEVDFTMPFVNLGIAILFSKSTVETKSLFSFMEPFNLEVSCIEFNCA
jgi:ionotropic glutamate receptor